MELYRLEISIKMSPIKQYKEFMSKRRLKYNNGKHYFKYWFLITFLGSIISILLSLYKPTFNLGVGAWSLVTMSYADFFVGIFFSKGINIVVSVILSFMIVVLLTIVYISIGAFFNFF